MDSTAQLIVWVLSLSIAYKLLDRKLRIEEEKIKLMKNREITDITKEWDSEL